ncbi:MAG: cell division protein SepF [Christensenellaceae bacterium]|jgi:cell division inhibitor SepF
MAGFWKRALGSFGKKNEDEYYEEYEDDEYYDEYDDEYDYAEEDEIPELEYDEPSFSRRRSKVISMPEGGSRTQSYANADMQMKMIIFQPSSYDETQSVIDRLRERKPVIVNLDEIEVAVAQRILDFISGAVYALNGDIKKAARNIFVVAPSNVEISTNPIGMLANYEEEEQY